MRKVEGMKAVVAMLKHETNTFSPVATPLARFGSDGPLHGSAAREAYMGTRTAIGAFIELCERQGIDYSIALAADARPSGPTSAATYETLCDSICNAIPQDCDMLMLDLHGAMVAANTDDGEGTLLKRIRHLHPDLPIGVALDMHANVTITMVENCTVLSGYRTYPHVDLYETGMRVGIMLLDAVTGKSRPVMAYETVPLMAHTLCMG